MASSLSLLNSFDEEMRKLTLFVKQYLENGDETSELRLIQAIIKHHNVSNATQKEQVEIAFLKGMEGAHLNSHYYLDAWSIYMCYGKKDMRTAAIYKMKASQMKTLLEKKIEPLIEKKTGEEKHNVFVITEEMMKKAALLCPYKQESKKDAAPSDIEKLSSILWGAVKVIETYQKPRGFHDNPTLSVHSLHTWDHCFYEVKLENSIMEKIKPLVNQLMDPKTPLSVKSFGSIKGIDYLFAHYKGDIFPRVTALNLAVQYRMKNLVKFLLDAGANVNYKSPLISALRNAWLYFCDVGEIDLTISSMLLEKGANPNNKSNNDWTALELIASCQKDKRFSMKAIEPLLLLLMRYHASPFILTGNEYYPSTLLTREIGENDFNPNFILFILNNLYPAAHPEPQVLNWKGILIDDILETIMLKIRSDGYPLAEKPIYLKIMNKLIELGISINPRTDRLERTLIRTNLADPELLVCLKNIAARFEDKKREETYPLGLPAEYKHTIIAATTKIETIHKLLDSIHGIIRIALINLFLPVELCNLIIEYVYDQHAWRKSPPVFNSLRDYNFFKPEATLNLAVLQEEIEEKLGL